MISPADDPNTAILTNGDNTIRLIRSGPTNDRSNSEHAGTTGWVTGRAGMQYRELLPGRHGGRIIASHIRLLKGGPVPDYVHYHRVDFQLIYCLKGAIRVVYEDQGEPFVLEPDDCVIQPPEIRHRVLEAEAGSEVIEIGVPAVHETWLEHEFSLPNGRVDHDRTFGRQPFVRNRCATAKRVKIGPHNIWSRDIIGLESTNGVASARLLEWQGPGSEGLDVFSKNLDIVIVTIQGGADLVKVENRFQMLEHSAQLIERGEQCRIENSSGTILEVAIDRSMVS